MVLEKWDTIILCKNDKERCNDVTMLCVVCTLHVRFAGGRGMVGTANSSRVRTVTEVLGWVNYMLHAPSIKSLYHLGATKPYLAKSKICRFVKAS